MTARDPYVVLTRAIDVHRRLANAGIDSAIGGALALAFHVDSPRTTDDIDVNVSLPATQARRALEVLPPDVPWSQDHLEQILRHEQVRLLWPVPGESMPIPLDLFFMADEFHEVVRSRTLVVAMLDEEIRIISATDLTVFKALFDRPKDWPDIQQMLDSSDTRLDLNEAVHWVSAIVGPDDARTRRLRSMLP